MNIRFRRTALSHAIGTALLLGSCFNASAGELGELLQGALDHPAVAAQRKQTESASRQLDAASARYFGAGSASADSAHYEDQRFLGVLSPAGFNSPAFARNQFRYGASYSLPIDLFGVIAASREAARRDLGAAELVLRQETLLKLHETVTAYSNLQSLQTQTAALSLQQQRVSATVARVNAQVESGELGLTDLRLAQSELARVEAERVRLEGEREQTLASLEEASGKRQLPQSAAVPLPVWRASSAQDSLPAQMAQAQAQAADAQARAERRALWPSLSAAADYYQYQGNGHDQDTWSVGAHLSVPLDAGAYRRSSGAQARAASAQEVEQAQLRKAQSQLAALHAAYDAAVANITALGKELAYRDQLVAVQEELQKVGAQTIEDSLRHERDRAEAQARLAQAQAQALQAWSAAQVLSGTAPEIYIKELDKR